MYPWRALPNVSNWQRCVSDGHQRSALIQEKHTVLLLKNLQTGLVSFALNLTREKFKSTQSMQHKEHAYLHLHTQVERNHNCSLHKSLSCANKQKHWASFAVFVDIWSVKPMAKICMLLLVYLFNRSEMHMSHTRLSVKPQFFISLWLRLRHHELKVGIKYQIPSFVLLFFVQITSD